MKRLFTTTINAVPLLPEARLRNYLKKYNVTKPIIKFPPSNPKFKCCFASHECPQCVWEIYYKEYEDYKNQYTAIKELLLNDQSVEKDEKDLLKTFIDSRLERSIVSITPAMKRNINECRTNKGMSKLDLDNLVNF